MQKTPKLHFCTDIPLQFRHRKIRSVSAALGVEVTDNPRQTFADLREMSPIQTLPLLETSEGNFSSSNTIIRYLAAKAGYKLYGGQNLYERALVDQWLDLLTCDFDTCALAVNLYLEGKQVDIEAVTADAQKFLNHLNKHLKNRKFVVGDSLTIADLAIATTIAPVLANMYGQQQRKKYTLISTWYHSLTALNKQIEPKELPKKINKKFEKKKDKNEKDEKQKGKDGNNKQQKGQKADKAEKGKKQQKQKQPKQGGQKKQKKQKKQKQSKGEQKKQKKSQKPTEDDLFGDEPEPAAPSQPKQKPKPKVETAAKKKAVAKSIVLFHVKVFEQQQNLEELSAKIREKINMDGLVWNNNIKLVPVAFGMNMLEMGCVIEDDKVSIEEDVYNKILTDWENEVQSIDTASFQKL